MQKHKTEEFNLLQPSKSTVFIKFNKKGIIIFCLISFLFVGLNGGYAQNLVANGGFEEYSDCPDNIGQIKRAVPWQSLNTGTPELFNTACGYSEIVPNNGAGYAGFIFFSDYEEAIEYLTISLNKPLEQNKYCVQFYAKAKASPFYSSGLGFILKQGKTKLDYWGSYRAKPSFSSDEVLVNNNEWSKITSVIDAQGGEDFLMIGNFLNPDVLTLQKDKNVVPKQGWQTYIYIDDVSIIKSDIGCVSGPTDNVVMNKENNLLEDILVLLFNFDDYTLGSENQMIIEAVLKNMNSEKIDSIQIIGFTDSLGALEYNKSLGYKRAEAVKNEMVKLFPEIEMITLVSEGEGKGLNNATQFARSLNRKVEVKINYHD